MSAEAALVFFFFFFFFRDTITIKTLFAGVGEERIALNFIFVFLYCLLWHQYTAIVSE